MNIREFFDLHQNIAVAFSGGVDSSVLLLLAKKYAKRVRAYYVLSPFQPEFEYEDAVKIADFLQVEMQTIKIDVLSDEKIVSNPPNRCYHCKKRIFEAILSAAEKDGFSFLAEGTNASDDISDRPGYRALKEMNVLSPLKECSYTKSEIRKVARENGLFVHSKPSYACLATRVPTGVRITKEILEKTQKAEGIMQKKGFRNFRIRYLDGSAKIELGKNEFELFYKNREALTEKLSEFYDNIYLDLRERADE